MKQYITPQIEVLRLGTTPSVITTSTETLNYKSGGDYLYGSQEEAW